jgi:hypothetical protein
VSRKYESGELSLNITCVNELRTITPLIARVIIAKGLFYLFCFSSFGQ